MISWPSWAPYGSATRFSARAAGTPRVSPAPRRATKPGPPVRRGSATLGSPSPHMAAWLDAPIDSCAPGNFSSRRRSAAAGNSAAARPPCHARSNPPASVRRARDACPLRLSVRSAARAHFWLCRASHSARQRPGLSRVAGEASMSSKLRALSPQRAISSSSASRVSIQLRPAGPVSHFHSSARDFRWSTI